ncbi:MAG: YidB family protein [Pseudomonadota bacterium]
MGLFDSIAGSVLGKFGGEQGGVAQAAIDLFNQNGGLSGILEKFKEGGLGEVAASWVGTGENLPISAEQLSSVLGNGAIADLAAKFGINPETLSAKIAEHLPRVVDLLTPDGEVPAESGNVLSAVLGMFK